MSEQSWVLKGIDPETREKAVAEAARRGVSLSDYLTDVVLQGALLEQMHAAQEQEPAQIEPPTPAQPENFVVRHRVEALERRLHLSVGGLDNAIHGLDSSMFGLASRIDDVEVMAAETADTLEQAMIDVGGNLAALRKRIADAEEQNGALNEAHEHWGIQAQERFEGVDHRIDGVEDAVRAAHTAAAQVAVAHEALKYAIAEDFSAFARESADSLHVGLDEVRAAAALAGEQADAAVAHLIVELRGVRIALEDRVAEGVVETRAKMQAAFADAAERMNSLSDRVDESERLAQRSVDHLRGQMADMEDAAQTALEETAETLRQAGAALAAEFARATRDNQTALDSVHGDLSGEISELRERQAAGLARLKQVDTVATANAADLATLRELLERSIAQSAEENDAALNEIRFEVSGQLGALTERMSHGELVAAAGHRVLRADLERVESSTLAALEKLGTDQINGMAALEGRLDQQSLSADGQIDQLRQRVDRAIEGQEAFQAGTLARFKLLDTAFAAQPDILPRLERIEADLGVRDIDHGLNERLLRLEALAESEATEQSIAALRGQIAGLAAQIDVDRTSDAVQGIAQVVADLSQRTEEANENAHSFTRMVGHLSTQHTDALKQADDRLHKLELAVADVRLEHFSADADMLAEIAQRVTMLEHRHAETLDVLRDDISIFIADNVRRLEALESNVEGSLADEVAAEFKALRQRMEDRILGVEQRSVRALEQVADTMSVLEKRFSGEEFDEARTA